MDKKIKKLKIKNSVIIFLTMFVIFLVTQKTEAASMPGDYLCSSVETNSGNCATLCASGLFEKKYGSSDGLFSGWVCLDKNSNDKTCSENKNCTSGYCNSSTKKCETKAGTTGTEMPGGSVCSTVDGNSANCATICASGLYERKTGITGSFKNYSCIAQKSTGESCTSNKQCVSTTCDQGTQKCVAKSSTYDTDATSKSETANDSIPGTATGGGIVTCGRAGGTMCTLCDLIKGIYDIVNYLMKIAIGIAVLTICIGGVLYVVSAGEPGLVEIGKKAIKNAIIGFVITLAAVLIIDTLILYIGAQSDLGISADWKTFSVDCTKTSSDADTSTQSTLKENEACVKSKAPYCEQGLECTDGKCVTETTTKEKCNKTTTQWVKTSSCASGGALSDGTRVTATVGLSDSYCSCRGSKPSGYICCDGVAKTTVLSSEKGCCLWPRGSYEYTKCADGLSSENDCTSLTEGKGDYVKNASCKDVVVGGAARKACQ